MTAPARSCVVSRAPSLRKVAPCRGFLTPVRCIGIAMLTGLIAAPAFAQCEDTSQQNAADEAGIKGDLDAASKCATPQQVGQS